MNKKTPTTLKTPSDQEPSNKLMEKYSEEYKIIKQSKLFDEEYYKGKYPEVTDIDPILHYLEYGAKKGYNPGPDFSTNKYYENFPDVKNANLNPLYHFQKNGEKEGRRIFSTCEDIVETELNKDTILAALGRRVSVIVPVFNAFDEVRECIRSVLLNTGVDYELVLIDDCSTDERVVELLDCVGVLPFVRVIHNSVNLGFIKSVNLGMGLVDGDVVLLNSDTVVTPRWLSRLVVAGYSDDDVGTVTPLSNASDICVEELGVCVDQLSLNRNAYLVDKLSDYEGFSAPTANGFCLFIKRAVIDDVGLFDEEFGAGYGEETDFSYRALSAGWRNVRVDSVFVYHERCASFSEDVRGELKVRNKAILSERYPGIFGEWDEFVSDSRLRGSLERIRKSIGKKENPERILCVTDLFLKPEMDENFKKLIEKYEVYVLIIETNMIYLGYRDKNIFSVIKTWNIREDWLVQDYLTLYFNILVYAKIDLLYVKYVKNFYHPELEDLSSFMIIVPKLEINVIYEATVGNNILETAEQMLNPLKSLKELVSEKNTNIDWESKKIAVYTAITGSYDNLVTPSVIDDDFDYICFTDNPDLRSEFWDIRLMEDLDLDSVRKARCYKILPHKFLSEYDYTFWIDANFDIIGDIKDYVNRYSQENKFLTIKHDLRDCVYEEADACIEMKKDSETIIRIQEQKYREIGYPEHNGLIASGILFRDNHDKKVIELCEDWFAEVTNYSRRDQLSFNYVCWRNNFKYESSPLFYFKNQYFQRVHHTINEYKKLRYSNKQVKNILESFKDKVTVIIPIYNAFEETRECIESVLKYADIPYELLLINDCSPDERIRPMLDHYAKTYEHIRVIHNTKNQGFVKNVNLGIQETSNDIVLLNSDTEVTPKWLQKMKVCAYTNKDIATVTPISNNAGAFSVPYINENNKIDEKLGVDGTANIVEKISYQNEIDIPTANGFCMYIKRDAIYSAGLFDIAFGKGYGEENDYSMRLLENGWKHVLDTSTYIYHKGNVSFLDEKDELIMQNRDYLEEKYPDYKVEINNFIKSKNFLNERENIERVLTSRKPEAFDKKRILYVIHEGNGGTLHTSVELMNHVNKNYDVYVLTAGKTHIKLYRYYDGVSHSSKENADDEFQLKLYELAKWPISRYTLKNPYNPRFARIYFHVIRRLKIDIIHIRHLIRHTFDLPRIGKLLGIPVILSFHDFYYVCPSHCLIDDKHNYCAGHCTNYEGYVEQCSATGGLQIPLLKTFVNKWRIYVKEMLTYCSEFVTTSQSAYDIYTEFYPELKNRPFDIIEHGRDLETPDNIENIVPELKEDEPIRILFPGHINYNKGGLLIKAIKELDTENKLEFHYMGNLRKDFELEKVGIHHGYYIRSEFCKHVKEIQPHYIGILSIWPETYCHTLTEAWSCGIPVIVIDIGALGERVHKNGGGIFVENDAQKAYDKILEVSGNADGYKKIAEQIPDINFKTTEKMGEEYQKIYEKWVW